MMKMTKSMMMMMMMMTMRQKGWGEQGFIRKGF